MKTMVNFHLMFAAHLFHTLIGSTSYCKGVNRSISGGSDFIRTDVEQSQPGDKFQPQQCDSFHDDETFDDIEIRRRDALAAVLQPCSHDKPDTDDLSVPRRRARTETWNLPVQGSWEMQPVIPTLLLPCCAKAGTTFLHGCMTLAFSAERVCESSFVDRWALGEQRCQNRSYLLPVCSLKNGVQPVERKELFFYGGISPYDPGWVRGFQHMIGPGVPLCHYKHGCDSPAFLSAFKAQIPMSETVLPRVATALFPGARTIDATPNYLCSPQAFKNFVSSYSAKDLGRFRFIVALRDPMARAYSEWSMFSNWNGENRTFETAVADELRTLRRCDEELVKHPHSLLTRGPKELLFLFSKCFQGVAKDYVRNSMYAACLAPWLKKFDRSQFLFLQAEEMKVWTAVELLTRISNFTGLTLRSHQLNDPKVVQACQASSYSNRGAPLPNSATLDTPIPSTAVDLLGPLFAKFEEVFQRLLENAEISMSSCSSMKTRGDAGVHNFSAAHRADTERLAKHRWPEVPIARLGIANSSQQKVLILYALLNVENPSAVVPRFLAERVLVSMEAFRRLGSKHQLEYGVLVPTGAARELEPLSKSFDFRIFERDIFADPETAPAKFKWLWSSRRASYDIMKIEMFNFHRHEYDKVALLNADSILMQRIDELFDDGNVYASRIPVQGGSGCWSSGFQIIQMPEY
jgi:hypothetical protein